MSGRPLPRALVIIPTHNEAPNLAAIVEAVLREAPATDILIVDGASTDGTARIADDLAAREARVSVLHRQNNEGLGRAYVDGYRHARSGGYRAVVQMDADFSHPPEAIEPMLRQLRHAELVIGSRYVRGGATSGWSRLRFIVSRLANLYVRAVTGMPVADATAGFRAYSDAALRKVDWVRIRSVGFAFQVEATYLVRRAGLRIVEFPITFRTRRAGESKIGPGSLLEALFLVPRLGFMHRNPGRGGWGATTVFGLFTVVFGLLKLYAVRPVVGDEGIYFYLGWRMSDGLFPYRDFIFVHPPMHIYVVALMSWLSGGAFAVLKAAPAVMTLATGVILYGLGRMKRFAELLPGPWWPLLPPLFYLFSYDVLRVSSHYVGVNQATFFVVAGLWLHLKGRPWLAGLGYASALASATYVAPLIGVLFLVFPLRGGWRAREERDDSRRALIATVAAFILIHLPVWILAPAQWWQQTVLFQLGKPPAGSTFAAAFRQLMSAEGFLAAASLLFTLFCLRRGHRERMVWLPLVGLGYIAVFSLLGRVYIYDLVPALPFLALGGGLFLRDVWASATTRRLPGALGMPALLVGLLFIQPFVYRGIPDVASDPNRVIDYRFNPNPRLGAANRIIDAILPGRRIVGLPVPGAVRYLWHENTWWVGAEALAAEIDRTLPAGGTLYGDSTTTPLLAFLSRRRLACELADTNTLHFQTMRRSVENDLACARGDGLALVVRQPGAGIDRLPEFQAFARAEGVSWRRSEAGKSRIEVLRWQAPVTYDEPDAAPGE